MHCNRSKADRHRVSGPGPNAREENSQYFVDGLSRHLQHITIPIDRLSRYRPRMLVYEFEVFLLMLCLNVSFCPIDCINNENTSPQLSFEQEDLPWRVFCQCTKIPHGYDRPSMNAHNACHTGAQPVREPRKGTTFDTGTLRLVVHWQF